MKYIVLFLAGFLMACAGSKELAEKPEAETEKIDYNESFDPLTLNDDDIVIVADAKISEKNIIPENKDNSQEIIPGKEVNGFRVQLIATKNIETASLVKLESTERFSRDGQNIYEIFEAPLYKIRVGDCLTRDDAEALRDLAQKYGYREAFIVKSKVYKTIE